MLPGFVERHLLIKYPFNGSHHRFKAVHSKGEGFMWLVVSLLLLMNKKTKNKKYVEVQFIILKNKNDC